MDFFSGVFKRNLQETLLIQIHAVSRVNPKGIINERFHCYFNKVDNINPEDKVSLHQLLQGLFFALYDCNKVLVCVTDISLSLVAIRTELPFTIDL